eukprot:7379104-Prymnesium_polylepis.2
MGGRNGGGHSAGYRQTPQLRVLARHAAREKSASENPEKQQSQKIGACEHSGVCRCSPQRVRLRSCPSADGPPRQGRCARSAGAP